MEKAPVSMTEKQNEIDDNIYIPECSSRECKETQEKGETCQSIRGTRGTLKENAAKWDQKEGEDSTKPSLAFNILK